MDNITHDYEYYEAHAKDVNLEDITSDEDNADLLARLRDNNDPEYFAFAADHEDDCDFVVRDGDDLGWLGYFVGRSDKVTKLFIEYFPDNINLNALYEGLGRNRSIQEILISNDLGESFKGLIPFVRNNDSLREFYFNDFDMGLQCARNIATLLSHQSSMKCLTFDGTIFDYEGLKIITAVLRSQPQIEELYVRSYGNSVGRKGFIALGKALEGCLSLRKLQLTEHNNNIDDGGRIDNEALHALATGLKHCHHLTSLLLDRNLMITEEGSRSFSTLFQSDSCRLECLDLDQMNIDDDGAAVLATGLASLPSLKTLSLWGMSISDQGLQHLVGGLVNCNLDQLYLSQNTLSISVLRALGTLVARRGTNIYRLSLTDCSLTDAGLQSFVEGITNCCNLTELNLSNNRSITANGLAPLSSLFRAEHCSLLTLELCGMHLGDDGAEILANGLIGDESLQTLTFDSLSDNFSCFAARGWNAFRVLLCDTSSVNNTYLSNHTLVNMGEFGYGLPSDIVQYLKLNELQNHATAICKILDSHPDIDVTPLFEFNLKCLSLVVAWFEKANSYLDEVNEQAEVFKNRQLSAVFKFIRGMPLLAVNGYRNQKMRNVQLKSKSKKRKLCS